VQSSPRIGSRLAVTAGVRLDRYSFLSATRVSPRAGVSVDLTREWSVRGSAGRFYQQPFFLFLTAFPGNRSLSPFRADHLVLGTDVTRGPMRMTAEVFQKRYAEYPVSSDVPSLSLANVGDTFAVREILFPLVSAGTGVARGIELSLEQRAGTSPFYGQLNVAVSRTRHAGADGVRRPGSFDYPVVVNALGGYRLSPKWDVSLRAAYLSGRPVTPYDAVLSSAQRRGVYELARINGDRAPDYVRLDVRVDRTFRINDQPVTVFAGVQNVTNRRNIAGYSWDRRANTQSTQEQLGIFPILGLDWQF
jgi:outer membrane cobalamin receptor